MIFKRSQISRVYKSRNIRNSFWIILEQIFQMLLSFVIGMLSARYLGPSNYGTLNYTASFVSFFLNIASLCMETIVVKKLVEYPDEEGIYLGSSIFFRMLSSLLSMIAIAIIVIVLNPNDFLKLSLAIIQSFQLLFRSFNILDSWFQRHLNSIFTSIGKIVASFVVSVYKLFLLITAKSIIWFAFTASLSDLIIAIMLFIFYKKNNGQKLKVKISAGWSVLSESYHFILSDMMSALYMNIDKVMLGKMLGDTSVGYYIAASTIASLWGFIPIALINSFRPTIFEIKQKNEFLYRYRLTQLFSLITWTSFLFTVAIFFLSDFIVSILYGVDYKEAVGALRILVWSQMLAFISVTRSIWIICEKKVRYVKYYVAIGLVVNVVLNYILIPPYGTIGASIATLCTSMVVLFFSPILFKETRSQERYLIEGFFLIWAFRRTRNVS